jgi:lysophospholipase L1-like esterase
VFTRLTGIATSLALLAAGTLSASAASHDYRGERGRPPSYLALGDSVPFGFSPLENPEDASNFIGYPDFVADGLGLALTNASCPGEASGGFISLTRTDNSCRPYRARYPLHVGYESSQLDFAVAFLDEHPRTKLVTLTLGANDAFGCERTDGGCSPDEFRAVLAALRAHLDTIYREIRDVYQHQIVAVTYYAFDYSDPQEVALTQSLNDVLASATRQYGGAVADGLAAFRPFAESAGGSSCEAGLLIRLPDGACDIHPSRRGHRLLAAATLRAVLAGTAPGPPLASALAGAA